MPKKKPYYPNNWKAYKDAHESFFLPMDYDEFMDWKIAGWEMTTSVICIHHMEPHWRDDYEEYDDPLA